MIRLTSFLWLWFQSVCPLRPSLSAYRLSGVSLTLDMEYLFTAAPASAATAPYFGYGVSLHGHCSWLWMWGISPWPLAAPAPRRCHSGFSRRWTVNFQLFKLDLEKAEEPEIKLPTSAGSSKKQESSRKTSISALLTMPKPLTVWITRNCGKFWKRWEYQTTWPASWETCMQVRKQQLELYMWQWTGSKLERSTSRLYIVTLLI